MLRQREVCERKDGSSETNQWGWNLQLMGQPDDLPGEPIDLCVGQAALLDINAYCKEIYA